MGVFIAYACRGTVDVCRLLQSGPVYHPLQHILPFALPEDVEPPAPGKRVLTYEFPCFNQTVEAFLVVEPSYGDDPFA